MSLKTSRHMAPFGLRMPESLKMFIEFSSDQNGRSMNAEVMERIGRTITLGELERFRSFVGEKGLGSGPINELLEIYNPPNESGAGSLKKIEDRLIQLEAAVKDVAGILDGQERP